MTEIAEVDMEVIGNKLYFIQKDGIEFTPQGIEKFFKLIEAVNIFDSPKYA